MDLHKTKALNCSHGLAQNQTASWLVHIWNTFGARRSHRQTRTHNIHHGQSFCPCWELWNGMSHTTYMQGNRGDSWHLVVRSQITNLTPGPSFGHNLCLKCPNGSCKPILNIYVLRAFQWYKELFNPLSFDPCSGFLKIQKSTRSPTPKVEVLLKVWGFIPSHFPTLESMLRDS